MRNRLLLLLVALAVLIAGCTKQSEPVETSTSSSPIATQPDSGIELVRFSDHLYGAEGLVPAGWTEVQYGVVFGGAEATDTELIIQRTAPGLPPPSS